MIFRTCEHYEDTENEDKFANLECIICLENKNNNEYNIILNLNDDYHKTCNCNAHIHNSCLHRWYLITKSCPICRNTIIKKRQNTFMNDFLKKKQLIINELANNKNFFLIFNIIIYILYFTQIHLN